LFTLLSYIMTRDDEKSDIISESGTLRLNFIGEYSKLEGWKRWVLVEKLTLFDEILR